jgi:hypothetical protein
MDDKPLGQGGFGVVYRAVEVDGRQVQPLAVKLFLDDASEMARRGLETVEALQRRLAAEQQLFVQAGRSLLGEYPALAAAPLLSFHGRMDGREVSGYVAADLSAMGLEEFGGVLEDDAKITRHQALPLSEKMEMAMQLVGALEFLHSRAGFLHCDLKAEALFIGVKPTRCALIDFDGGAVMLKPDDAPTTWGTMQPWLAPEILAQMQQASATQTIEVSLATEQWSLALALHHILLAVSPMFFLSEVSARSIKAYTQRFVWPEIDVGFPYFRSGMETAYEAYVRYLRSAFPAELLRHFRFTMNQGYANSAQRTTFSQWKTALGAANRPAILRFQADRILVRDTRPVRLMWEVTGAKRLELRGIGEVTGEQCFEVEVKHARDFELVLTAHSGKQIVEKLRIQVDDRPPRIHAFYADRQFLTDARPVRLFWAVSGSERLEIDSGVGDVTACPHFDVSPLRDTTFTLRAISGFGVETRSSLSLQVSKQAPVIEYFRVRPLLACGGDEVELDWKVTGAETVFLVPAIGGVAAKGSRKVLMPAHGEFTLRASSRFGVEAWRTVAAHALKRTTLAIPRTALQTETVLIHPTTGTIQVGRPVGTWGTTC